LKAILFSHLVKSSENILAPNVGSLEFEKYYTLKTLGTELGLPGAFDIQIYVQLVDEEVIAYVISPGSTVILKNYDIYGTNGSVQVLNNVLLPKMVNSKDIDWSKYKGKTPLTLETAWNFPSFNTIPSEIPDIVEVNDLYLDTKTLLPIKTKSSNSYKVTHLIVRSDIPDRTNGELQPFYTAYVLDLAEIPLNSDGRIVPWRLPNDRCNCCIFISFIYWFNIFTLVIKSRYWRSRRKIMVTY